jgi:hypothetical protein
MLAAVAKTIGTLKAVALRSDEPDDSKKILAELVGSSHGLCVEFTDCLAVASYALVIEVTSISKTLAIRQSLGLRPLELSYRYRGQTAAVVRHESGMTLLLVESKAQHTNDSARSPVMTDALFADVPKQKIQADKDKLAELYAVIGRTADDLPYTPEFERLYNDYAQSMPGSKIDHAEVWRHLLTMRKAGKLAKLGPAKTAPPETTPEERELLKQLLGTDIGKRDRLPYSPKFDQVHEAFNKVFQKNRRRTLSPHLLWRLIATLAK